MHKVLLDTDVFSEVLKGRNEEISRRARAYQAAHGAYTISAITVVESIAGWQHKGDIAKLFKLETTVLPSVEILPLDEESARRAGRIHGELLHSGRTIGRADPMIAGIALANDLPLVTGNREHYQRIVESGWPLRIESWS